MNERLLTEIKSLLRIFGECGQSICDDIKSVDCKSPKNVPTQLLPSILFKIKKLQECLVAIGKICKALKKEDVKCLPCYK